MLRMLYFHKKTTCIFVHVTWITFVRVLSPVGEATRAKLLFLGAVSWV